tara:strand:- start:40 stop:225 length:186 start_codon:yes stop_codon:yes gene_type:complete
MDTANYQKLTRNTGELFELCGTYDVPENEFRNPPNMLTIEEQDMIVALMKKNRIKRLDVII